MRLSDLILLEAPSPIVYHFTGPYNIVKILETDALELSPFLAKKAEQDALDTNKLFYLSTTRSKLGAYGQSQIKMFALVLDGRKLQNNYASKSVDYWQASPERSELEDRIITDKPRIEKVSNYIKSIDIFISPNEIEDGYGQIKSINDVAKKHSIPVRVFKDVQSFNSSKKWISADDLLKGQEHEEWKPYVSKNNPGIFVQPYINAIKGENLDETRTAKLIYSLKYDMVQEIVRIASADLHNANTTNEMRELTMLAKRLKLNNIEDIIKYLKQKYSNKK